MSTLRPELEVMQHRALLYGRMRQYFITHQYLEIDLPLVRSHGDAQVSSSFSMTVNPEEGQEVIMAQVIAHYQTSVYQFGRVLAVPQHKTHVDESAVCWGAPHRTLDQLKDQMADLLGLLFEQTIMPVSCSYLDAVARRLALACDTASAAQFKAECRRLGVYVDYGEDRQAWQQTLFYQFVEPTLGLNEVVYLTDCPRFAGQPEAQVLVYLEGLVIGILRVVAEQPVATLMLDRLLMVMEGTRRLARVQWLG